MTSAQVATILTRAFWDYAVSHLLAPDEATRHRLLPWMYERCVRHAAVQGGVITLDAGGAALWLDSQVGPSLTEAWRAGLVTLPLRTGLGAYRRMSAHEAVTHHLVDGAGAARYGYLWFAGVDPAAQGRGLGRELLRQTFTAMAARGLRVCLLSTEEAVNTRIWSRLGFEEIAAVPKTPGGLPLWIFRQDIETPAPGLA